MVAAILETPEVSGDFATYLCERTAGVPFAIEEMLMLLRGRGTIVRREGRWVRDQLERLSVPLAVSASVTERLGQLSVDTQGLAARCRGDVGSDRRRAAAGGGAACIRSVRRCPRLGSARRATG